MGACRLKTSLKFSTKRNKMNKDSLLYFFVFIMCQNCWISNTTESYNLKLSRNHKERIKRKLHFFLNSFSVDQIDIFFRVALSPFSV